MARNYYVLFVRFPDENPDWTYEFGDYDRATVKDECTDFRLSCDALVQTKIVCLPDDQKAIDAYQRELNLIPVPQYI